MAAKPSGTSPDKRRNYGEAFKEEALRLARESRSTPAAARQLGISPKLLYSWQQAQPVAEVGSVEVARDPEVWALRAVNKRLAQELDILKKTWSSSASRPREHVPLHPPAYQLGTRTPALPRAGRDPGRVLRVAAPAQRPTVEPAWQLAVRAAFADHSQRYGTRRLRAEVQAQRYVVGRWRIRRVLNAHGLRAQQPRSFVPRTTDSDPTVRAAPNRLLGLPAPTAPDRVWVGDITYLPRQGGGWLYLAVWLDRCSRKIVGWDVRESMPEDLVSEALRRALAVRQPRARLIVHSDQGSK